MVEVHPKCHPFTEGSLAVRDLRLPIQRYEHPVQLLTPFTLRLKEVLETVCQRSLDVFDNVLTVRTSPLPRLFAQPPELGLAPVPHRSSPKSRGRRYLHRFAHKL